MSELICNIKLSKDPTKIPAWVLEYLLTQPLQDILHSAAVRTEHEIIPLDAEVCILRHLDIIRILRRRWIEVDADGSQWNALSFYRDRNGSIVPFMMISASHTAMVTEPLRDKVCIVEAQWPQRLSERNILSICTLFAIDSESGQRLHLRSHISNVRPSEYLNFCQVMAEASRPASGIPGITYQSPASECICSSTSLQL